MTPFDVYLSNFDLTLKRKNKVGQEESFSLHVGKEKGAFLVGTFTPSIDFEKTLDGVSQQKGNSPCARETSEAPQVTIPIQNPRSRRLLEAPFEALTENDFLTTLALLSTSIEE